MRVTGDVLTVESTEILVLCKEPVYGTFRRAGTARKQMNLNLVVSADP